MKASEDFRYCPKCWKEIPLMKCRIEDYQCESYIPKFAPLSNNIQDYEKKSYTMIRYLCPNDNTVLEERIQ